MQDVFIGCQLYATTMKNVHSKERRVTHLLSHPLPKALAPFCLSLLYHPLIGLSSTRISAHCLPFQYKMSTTPQGLNPSSLSALMALA